MLRIVECVPNISDGRNPDVYNTIARASEKISGVKLLDIDPGYATNRTVITFAGAPEVIVDAAFEVIKASKDLIDMRKHKGEHARMGATDVCPFVPVSGVTLEECADLARQLAQRVGNELGVWAYLYEHAASKPEWKSLTNVRKGEYEGLASREGKEEWKPDAGPKELDPKFGAVAISARKFLIAYNINVNSKNVTLAKDIAYNIRETGRVQRESYPDGKKIKGPNGKSLRLEGIFQHCKSTAWLIPEYNRAQITMNLTDIDVTPVHKVFDEVDKQCLERGMRITGSEIVGLVPLQTMIEAGIYYAEKQGLSRGVSEEELINIAILSLGLDDVAPFNPDEKIVEYRFKRKDGLVDLTCTDFINTLASDAPAPGGGSVAALCGAMSAALGSMVSSLTYHKPEYKSAWSDMVTVGEKGEALKRWFLDAVDRDTDAFNAVMDAMRLPKKSEEQKDMRLKAIEEANKECTRVPLTVLEKATEVIEVLLLAAEKGNPNCASDVGVGAHCMLTCAEGAALNVRINVGGIKDDSFVKECLSTMEQSLELARKSCKEILSHVDKNL